MEINQHASSSAAAAAHRRINLIASHFTATDDSLAAFPNLLPMNCSSTVNFAAPRGDSRMYFARQGSACQASFMRQVSQEQGSLHQPEVTLNSCLPSKGMAVTALNRLVYSRPETIERKYSNLDDVQVPPQGKDCSLYAADPPKFAKPNSIHEQDVGSFEQISIQKPVGTQWCPSPKMDVAETRTNYVVTVEAPGIDISDMRVEVNNQNLVVMGKRATQWWRITSCTVGSVSKYHKRGIAEGPYQVQWQLPADANRDAVTAQFVNGILEVTIPKIQACCA